MAEDGAPATSPGDPLKDDEVITGDRALASPIPRPFTATELAPLPGAVLVTVTPHWTGVVPAATDTWKVAEESPATLVELATKVTPGHVPREAVAPASKPEPLMVTVDVDVPDTGTVRADGDSADIWFPVTAKEAPAAVVPPSGLTTVSV